jgi:CPA1 family monovalent cation:H+ antiporter
VTARTPNGETACDRTAFPKEFSVEEFLAVESIIIVLVVVATFVAIAARRIRLPYTVSLVLVGLLISIPRTLEVEVTPELILALFVPPLIFEAAFHLDFRLFRDNLVPIIVLAVPGVLLAALIVGALVTLGTTLALPTALVFGTLIAATDPVAVVSLLRDLGVPRRLSVALEGESLFNDGTAIVLFNVAVAAVLSGAFDPVAGIFDFLRVAAGGLAIGAGLGWIAGQLIARVDDRLVVTTLTTLLAYGSYVAAERFHVSGVLAVVAAGLLSGNVGLAGASPTTKIMLFNLWEFLAFLANSLVFLLIGLNVDLAQLWANMGLIAVGLVAVLFSRALLAYGLPLLAHRRRGRAHLPVKWRHVLFWGGLRGAISLALALSLPVTMAGRETLQAMTFGVVLFALMAQGTTIQFLLKRLGLTRRSPGRLSHEIKLGQLFAAQAGMRRLEELYQEGLLPTEMWDGLQGGYEQDRDTLVQEMNRLFLDHAELEREMLLQARREALRAERGALGEAFRRGLLSDDAYRDLVDDVDHRLEALDLIQGSLPDIGGEQEE